MAKQNNNFRILFPVKFSFSLSGHQHHQLLSICHRRKSFFGKRQRRHTSTGCLSSPFDLLCRRDLPHGQNQCLVDLETVSYKLLLLLSHRDRRKLWVFIICLPQSQVRPERSGRNTEETWSNFINALRCWAGVCRCVTDFSHDTHEKPTLDRDDDDDDDDCDLGQCSKIWLFEECPLPWKIYNF